MIWLASFPRSGNTYFRNILFEVYGISSSTYHHETDYPVDANYADFPVVKTHLLPHQIEPRAPQIPAVYLVRDGRDATISLAHHRSDLVAPGSDLLENVDLSIRAAGGSFFGGWSENVRQWITRADIVIRYEDLIVDPIGQVERLRSIMDLPEPRRDRLPTFGQLKRGEAEYGAKQKVTGASDEIQHYASKNFRKGRSGTWKEELPEQQQLAFWHHHGEMMELLGYMPSGELDRSATDAYPHLTTKFGRDTQISIQPTRILIEGSKLADPYRDGVQRYSVELMRAIHWSVQWTSPDILIDVAVEGQIVPLRNALEAFDSRPDGAGKPLMFRIRHTAKQVLRQTLGDAQFDRIWGWLKRTISRRFLNRVKSDGSGGKPTSYDLVHVLLPQNAPLISEVDGPRVCTIHDVTDRTHPHFHTAVNRNAAHLGMQQLRDAVGTSYIAISESTKRDLLQEYPYIDESRIRLISESIDRHHFSPTYHAERKQWIRRMLGVGEAPFLLTLSTLEPRKNLLNVLRAFEDLKRTGHYPDLKLVCAGNRGWMNRSEYKSLLRIPDVVFPGFIDEEWLPDAYSEAVGLCYVSHYEGFGLPILEALACGTPVLCGKNSSQPEVAGAVGVYADAEDIDAIAEGMKELLEAGEHPEIMRTCMHQSWNFSWYRVARETLQYYLDIAKS